MDKTKDAVTFLKEFILAAREDKVWESDTQKRTFFSIYREDQSKYTVLVNKCIIPSIIEKCGLSVQHEYFRVDTIGWKARYQEIDEKEALECELKRHFWDLQIAVEHENSKNDWMDEVTKLVHIRCPLKVVIAYNNCDARENEEQKKLAFIGKWMQKLSAFDSSGKEDYLIIIGNGKAKLPRGIGYTQFDYRGYLFDYNEKCFKQLNVE